LAIESIALAIEIEPIPPLDDEIGARARSARVDNTLYFADIPGIFNNHSILIVFLSGGWDIRVKHVLDLLVFGSTCQGKT
jgi:hypothetical protein